MWSQEKSEQFNSSASKWDGVWRMSLKHCTVTHKTQHGGALWPRVRARELGNENTQCDEWYWLSTGQDLEASKRQTFDMCMREFPGWGNWGGNTYPKCGWLHAMFWGPTLNKKEKASQAQHSSLSLLPVCANHGQLPLVLRLSCHNTLYLQTVR